MVTSTANNVCRRCKKKRPEDEPMETARYRTCKPCREIERKRKRLKKLNYTGVDDDAAELSRKNAAELEQSIINIASHVTKSLPQDAQHLAVEQAVAQQVAAHHHHQQQLHQQQLHQQHMQQGPPEIQQYDQSKVGLDNNNQPTMLMRDDDDTDKEIPIDENLLTGGHDAVGNEASLTKSPTSPTIKSDNAANAFAVIQQDQGKTDLDHTLSSVSPSADGMNLCVYCGARRSIDDDGRYQLCANCVANPLEKANVFDDFESYLQRIELGKEMDLKNVIFIKKFDDDDSVITHFTQDNLEQILIQLQDSFIDKVMLRSGFKFSRASSNLSVKPFPKSIKLLYKCKQDIKTMQKQNTAPSSPGNVNRKLKSENCNSNFYLSYDVIGKNLIIKYNHCTHKTFIEKLYSTELINKVRELQQSFGDLNDVFNQLAEADGSMELKSEISQLRKGGFVKDFGTMFV